MGDASAGTKSLTTSAFELIKTDILMGKLRPEERLRVQGLSGRYGIGATGIREALSRLVTDGLVEVEDQRGFCVASVSREELLDLTETRIGIEQMALTKAAKHGDVDWETRVLGSFHRLSRTPLPETPELQVAWGSAHRQFHEALVSGCQSPWLVNLCRMLYDQSERYRNLAAQHTTRKTRDAADEHQQLLDAALGHDADTLCELIASHFRETTRIILRAEFGQSGEMSPPRRRNRFG